MRIAFLGKGGAGKTTTSAGFIQYMAKRHPFVLAVDADVVDGHDIGMFQLADGADLFDAFRSVLDGVYHAIAWVLLTPPFYVTALLIGILGWRAVFVLMEIEQLTAPETADALGVNLNTVYSRLRLARRDYNETLERLRTHAEGTPS